MENANTSSKGSCDFISKLPDPILHHILGLLDTKEAVQTCVLSKRWEHLWTSLCSLNFNYDDFHSDYDDGNLDDYDPDDDTWFVSVDCEWFAMFVNTFLLRREHIDLDVFRLSCKGMIRYANGYDSEEDVEINWIHYAVEHNTRVLHLSLGITIPFCIYTCTSLEELYLSGYLDFDEIDSPVQIVNLPNLRKLTIYQSALHPNYVKNLLSGCPILEFLQLDRCFLIGCVIAHKCLNHLSIINCDTDKTRLVISAPNFLSFFYDGEFSPSSKTTLNMPSLASSCLMSRNFSMMKCLEGMTTFLSFLTNIELLELHFTCHWLEESAVLPLELPIFSNLKNLTVALCMSSRFQMVYYVLKSSPNLKKLVMLQEECACGINEDYTDESTNASSMISVSPCKKLEIVEFKYWRYNKKVQRLVDTLMDGTTKFKNLKIHLSKYESSKQF